VLLLVLHPPTSPKVTTLGQVLGGFGTLRGAWRLPSS
jgi:hypothetical protein